MPRWRWAAEECISAIAHPDAVNSTTQWVSVTAYSFTSRKVLVGPGALSLHISHNLTVGLNQPLSGRQFQNDFLAQRDKAKFGRSGSLDRQNGRLIGELDHSCTAAVWKDDTAAGVDCAS